MKQSDLLALMSEIIAIERNCINVRAAKRLARAVIAGGLTKQGLKDTLQQIQARLGSRIDLWERIDICLKHV